LDRVAIKIEKNKKNRVLKEERRNKENYITRPYNKISFAISTYGQHIQLKTS
jgi:hypothetical protein